MKTFQIRSDKDLEQFKDEYGYNITGNAEFIHSVDIEKRIIVDGYLEVKAGRAIKAGRYIKAGEYIEAGGAIKAGRYIEAGEYIKAGEYIEAGGSIEAGEYIEAGGSYGISAGLYISAKGVIKFGLKCFAGICTWREISDEEKTITCSKFEGGTLEYGILKETGTAEIEELTMEEVCKELGRNIKIKK